MQTTLFCWHTILMCNCGIFWLKCILGTKYSKYSYIYTCFICSQPSFCSSQCCSVPTHNVLLAYTGIYLWKCGRYLDIYVLKCTFTSSYNSSINLCFIRTQLWCCSQCCRSQMHNVQLHCCGSSPHSLGSPTALFALLLRLFVCCMSCPELHWSCSLD